MDANRIRRFARHLSLPEVGFSGQEAIDRANVIAVCFGEEAQLALDAAREYLLASGVRSVGSPDVDSVVTRPTVVVGDSDQASAMAKTLAIPLVLLDYSDNAVRILSSSPPHDRPPRALVLPGRRLAAGNIAIGGLVAAEILWQIVGGPRPT